jgi:predicted membrane protein
MKVIVESKIIAFRVFLFFFILIGLGIIFLRLEYYPIVVPKSKKNEIKQKICKNH